MPYSVKGFFEINEDMIQILLMLEVLFTQDSRKTLLIFLIGGYKPPIKNYQKAMVNQRRLGLSKDKLLKNIVLTAILTQRAIENCRELFCNKSLHGLT